MEKDGFGALAVSTDRHVELHERIRLYTGLGYCVKLNH